MHTRNFSFRDIGTGNRITVKVTAENNGLCIQPAGTGIYDEHRNAAGIDSGDGDYGPIYLKIVNGKPVLHVWTDINSKEAVEIDLANALESNRTPTGAVEG